MEKELSTDNLGRKINVSHVVFQVTKLIYEGVGDTQIARILLDRYSFKVSTPSVASFRANHYEKRLQEMQQFSNDFQQKQTGRIQTFIDESLEQAHAIKADIVKYGHQVADMERQLAWVKKFEFMFQSAIDQYVKNFDPSNPDPEHFLQNPKSPEEQLLQTAVSKMGAEGISLLTAYVSARSMISLAKAISGFRHATLTQRESLVKIHRDIFKGYRNFSIMQELVTIFEKYNALIVEEFFPDRKTMDKTKYFRVRKRILALFDEFQIRYQGVESPNDDNNPTTNPDAEREFAESATSAKVKEMSKTRYKLKNTHPGNPIRDRNPIVPDPTPAPNPMPAPDHDIDELRVIPNNPNPAPITEQAKESVDRLFSTLIDTGTDVISDLDVQADRVQKEKEPSNVPHSGVAEQGTASVQEQHSGSV